MSYAPQPPAAGPTPLRPDEERTWSLLSHLGGIIFGFIPSLVIWLVFKGRGPFLEDQAKEALNFQITVTIAAIVGFVISFIIPPIGLLVWLANIVFCILAAVAVNKGTWYRYPATLRLVK
ncbi:DUF4870 domain-containing protein [Cellulomonas triticagri]|uniref:DUF4870 domain-containing protein n=1 Tax=Cellulomonas triticagri TaxID=2483352 RepID=A0A3M2JVX3_9CELL|nr:DUF4870 domain-containing protein [Cellulomonas triticagri]RMI14208.1 DUF4870 domain-containing protein [Cellulomonas triticagri]